jgi:hypothetical protein
MQECGGEKEAHRRRRRQLRRPESPEGCSCVAELQSHSAAQFSLQALRQQHTVHAWLKRCVCVCVPLWTIRMLHEGVAAQAGDGAGGEAPARKCSTV